MQNSQSATDVGMCGTARAPYLAFTLANLLSILSSIVSSKTKRTHAAKASPGKTSARATQTLLHQLPSCSGKIVRKNTKLERAWANALALTTPKHQATKHLLDSPRPKRTRLYMYL